MPAARRIDAGGTVNRSYGPRSSGRREDAKHQGSDEAVAGLRCGKSGAQQALLRAGQGRKLVIPTSASTEPAPAGKGNRSRPKKHQKDPRRRRFRPSTSGARYADTRGNSRASNPREGLATGGQSKNPKAKRLLEANEITAYAEAAVPKGSQVHQSQG